MTKVTATVGPCRHGCGANAMRMMALGAVLAGVLAAESASAGTLEHAIYSTTRDGQAVDIFTMTNNRGMRVRFLSYGGVITEIDVPDRAGRVDNIALGQRGLLEYETLLGHFGAITGRYANRIGGAQFTLNGKTYHLIANNGANTLHGGPNALDRRVWTVVPAAAQNGLPPSSLMSARTATRTFPAP